MRRHEMDEGFEAEYIYDDIDEVETILSEASKERLKMSGKAGRPHARHSVEEYLERKRLRNRYKELFDDYFGEKS